MLTLVLGLVGALLAAPFLLLRAIPSRRLIRVWLAPLAAVAVLWGVCALIFHGGLILPEHRLLAVSTLNGPLVALVLAVGLGAIAAMARAVHLRTSGK